MRRTAHQLKTSVAAAVGAASQPAAAATAAWGAVGLSAADQQRIQALAALNHGSDPLHIRRQVSHIAAMRAELGALLPKAAKLLQPAEDKKTPGAQPTKSQQRQTKGSTIAPTTTAPMRPMSIAEIATATAFYPETLTTKGYATDSVALPTMYQNAAFLEAPVASAMRQRLHFLSSEQFAHAMAWKSVSPTAQPATAPGTSAAAEQLIGEINKSFGSVEAFRTALRAFACNRLQDGFTWVVWNPKAKPAPAAGDAAAVVAPSTTTGAEAHGAPRLGRLEIFNAPRNELPQIFGFWPVLCVNMTERAVLSTPKDNSARFAVEGTMDAAGNSTAAAPKWSRAARNPEASRTQNFTPDETPQFLKSLEAQRASYVDFATVRLDLEFGGQQLAKGIAYYASEARLQKVAKRTNEVEVAAVRQAIAEFKLVVHEGAPGAAVEEKPVAVSEGDAAAAAAAISTASDAPVDGSEVPGGATNASAALSALADAADAADAVPRSAPASPTAPTPPAAAPPKPTVVREMPADADGTVLKVYSDGSQEWHYATGAVTTVLADGTQVFKEPGKPLTTVRPDGSQLFEFDNGSTIELRDGMQITTYANGEKHTEVLSQAPK